MLRPVPVLVIAIASMVNATVALAQSSTGVPVRATQEASIRDGRVQGLVRDNTGKPVGGVSIVALGTTIQSGKSDERGRFSLTLVPGEYVLRASRDGYVSTYRELIRIQTSALIERTITVAVAGAQSQVDAGDANGKDDYARSEAAWRLRHLSPTALRDIAPWSGDRTLTRGNLAWAPSSSWFSRTALTGQVNFLTTGAASVSSGVTTQVPRGVTSLSLGAPVGTSGDWSVRGAMAAADLSSWILLGEYRAREHRAHVFTLGFAYSVQDAVIPLAAPLLAGTPADDGARRAGGVYGFDRWRVGSGLELDYGVRMDRYDYIAQPELLSPRVAARVTVRPGIRVTMAATERSIAPGADQLMPSPSAAVWLPPGRTFAPLVEGTALQAERVRQYGVGLERQFGTGAHSSTIAVERFRQSSTHQFATLFGADEVDGPARDFVATPGNVSVDGWSVRATGNLNARMRGTVDYSVSSARWMPGADVRALEEFAPAVIRQSHERLHDVTTTLEAFVPQTSTRVSLCYRANTAFSRTTSASAVGPSARFDVEVHQSLPYHPVRGSRMEALLAIRSLFREVHDAGSIYDELLTVKPPMRIVGGVLIKF